MNGHTDQTDPCTAYITNEHSKGTHHCTLEAGHSGGQFDGDHAGPVDDKGVRYCWGDNAIGATPHQPAAAPVSSPSADHTPSDVGTEFVRQADHLNRAGIAAFEAALAGETVPKADSKPADHTPLRETIADTLAAADGWTWVDGFDRSTSPVYRGYLKRADAVLAKLPSADRAAVLAEAIRRVEDPEERAKTSVGLGLGWEAARDVLRRMADEQPAEAQPQEDPARIDRLRPEFFEHASVEAIDVQIRRAQRQQRHWGNRERTLTILRQARVLQKEQGEWPAAVAGQDGAQQEASGVVAYRMAVSNNLYCTLCAGSPEPDRTTPLTSGDLPDGGVCAGCGVDVLIPQENTRD